MVCCGMLPVKGAENGKLLVLFEADLYGCTMFLVVYLLYNVLKTVYKAIVTTPHASE